MTLKPVPSQKPLPFAEPRYQWLLVMAWFACLSVWTETAKADIKADEQLVFFHSDAWYDSENNEWVLPIHLWVYEPEDSEFRKFIAESFFESHYDLKVTDENKSYFDERINLIISDNERNKSVTVSLCGLIFSLNKTTANGHSHTQVRLTTAQVDNCAQPRLDMSLRFIQLSTTINDRTWQGVIRLLPPTGISIVSDIDDTVKISEVTDRKRLLENTFFLPFSAVSGMAIAYQTAANEGAAVHFVSSSPWYLYQPLLEFSQEAGFPWASFSLKDFRFRDETFFNLFKSGDVTKPEQISEIIDRYRKRQFILIGDSGEQDPEVYEQIRSKYPDQIIGIAIRNVTNDSLQDERYRGLRTATQPFLLFTDAAELGEFTQILLNARQ